MTRRKQAVKGAGVLVCEARGGSAAPRGQSDGADFRCWREDGEARASVPRRVTQHSPTGYEWGYNGSGPADLALNVLEDVLLHLGHRGPRVKCWQGECFEAAWLAHHDFKRHFLAAMPHEGGVIPRETVSVWLLGWMVSHGAAAAHGPEAVRVAGD